jgi:hypothetical protein
MAMQTGENEQALRKILDMSRLISIVLLTLHFYYQLYAAFKLWGFQQEIVDRIMGNLASTGLFATFHTCKFAALLMLGVSLLGAKGKKDEKLRARTAFSYLFAGLLLYFASYFFLGRNLNIEQQALIYMAVCGIGFLFILSGGILLTRIIRLRFEGDIFNSENETFPQEERLLDNEYSINLPAKYKLRSRVRNSWINVINPFRGLLISGTPGAGKSYFIIRHIISQHIAKGFSMLIYDFKFPDLSEIAYHHYLKHSRDAQHKTRFFAINFENLNQSHRCNPLDPSGMNDITDAAESARTILLGLNREWIKKQGDFFVESPINFLTAVIWYLRRFRGGKFCTMPHVIEFMQLEYDHLFTLLRSDPEIEVIINPFMNAYLNDAKEQLEGQLASAKIAMSRLSSPQLYYVLSGNDFTLDLNNPREPKIICMGNEPQKTQVYGAVLSLFINRMIKQVNRKGQLKSSLVFDEFPTIYLNGIDMLMATARSNKVATTLAVQDLTQLRKDYGREQADVIMGIAGNIISGQVTGDTAKLLSDRIGRIMQERNSLSINSGDTSISKSRQLEAAVPASKIAALSSGEFVGMVADDPQVPISLKAFHSSIINDHDAIEKEIKSYKPIPDVAQVTAEMIQENFRRIRDEVQLLVQQAMLDIMEDPALQHLIVKK